MSRDDPAVLAFGALAREFGTAILISFPERPDAGKSTMFISAVVFDRTGTMVHSYRKSHLWGPYEKDIFTAGIAGFRCFTIDGWAHPIGLAICFDLEFPVRTAPPPPTVWCCVVWYSRAAWE